MGVDALTMVNVTSRGRRGLGPVFDPATVGEDWNRNARIRQEEMVRKMEVLKMGRGASTGVSGVSGDETRD